jgi:UDP-N-acetylmuramoyl-tripeptide--D-alanyl-D-alanine ligase
LEYLGNLEGVAQAKAELLPHIDPSGCAVLNKDDDHVAAMAEKFPGQILFFGHSQDAQVRAESVKETPSGLTFDLVLPDERIAISLNVPGRFMVSNALAAAAAGMAAGLDAAAIKVGLEQFNPVGGRLNVVQTANGVTIIDDTYNANPASMAAAISTFESLSGGARGFIVLGDMLELGSQAERLHRYIGTLAAQSGACKLYAHGDHAEGMLTGARAGGMAETDLLAGAKAVIIADLAARLKSGDWLLVKGSRGMAMETVVAAIRQWGDAPDENIRLEED